ncbi:NADH:flavin oxidoreductase/NADH oxidase [Enterovirga rhinocerotis]|uniref:2,4-dienoyl-CoA reductase-like NADH-dependent reductase (Old Yellow Enzyme family) n=1 Tax=Enterovirga rhinocerotis TaxID=1339210 RepID=A0A4V3DXT6_9HYPH|nr:NADH:flavin oxidoreductase/NADH oxidase [Enterovirga rhinocerotis]TDR89709.1 2,4-dienoyl-CoA reductase-like NADH-dependent reductase (Old Yellow Enzyme family) [Enterovirga rhinocerotis]
MSTLFSPLALRRVTLPNRVVVSPMQQYMAGDDALPNDFHLQHYGRLGLGGAGLVFTEALAVSPEGRVTHHDLGIWSDDYVAALKPIVAAIAAGGAVPATQLIHAGRKGSVGRPWEGYNPLDAASAERGEAPWQTVAASAIPANPGWHVPEALDEKGIARLIAAYADGARRAAAAGFRVLDIHAAHGYLIHSFLSPIGNKREDGWGGDFDGRIRFLLEITKAVRAAWPADLPLFVRLSCIDDQPDGWTLEDSVELSRRLKALGVDVIDCSSGGLGERTTTKLISRPEGYQVPFAERIRAEAKVPTMAVGLITTPAFAESVVAEGRADLVAIGREALMNPHWPLQAARALGHDQNFGAWPPAWGWWLEKRARAAAARAPQS